MAAESLVVLDTNLALDLLVFDDPACVPLREALAGGALRWIATGAMRDELARVLGYPLIVTRLARMSRDAPSMRWPSLCPPRRRHRAAAKTRTTRCSSTWQWRKARGCSARTALCWS